MGPFIAEPVDNLPALPLDPHHPLPFGGSTIEVPSGRRLPPLHGDSAHGATILEISEPLFHAERTQFGSFLGGA